jgi:Xaa-Pro aminopeptidase
MALMKGVLRPGVPESLPFAVSEYQDRRASVRAAMDARGIDVLYVTSPANLFYLTGYEAVWYPSRLPLGAVVDRASRDVLLLDWSRHEGYVGTRVLCDQVSFLDYGVAPEAVCAAFAEFGWLSRVVGIEWSSSNPTAGVMAGVADALRQRGAAVVSGDWLVDGVRLYKSQSELACIRRAGAIADAAMLELQQELRPGMSGLEVSSHLNAFLARRGSEVAATPPLVNFGPTAWSDTHAFPTRRLIQCGDVVAVDCCAVIDRYHVNLARTFAVGRPNPRAAELLDLAAGSIVELQRAARIDEGPEIACALAERYVRDRVPAQNIWWVGGYSLGISFPPSWVGHTYLANDGPEKCRLSPGYVSNYENVLLDRQSGFEAAYIDTLVMSPQGIEVLSSIPRGLLPSGG